MTIRALLLLPLSLLLVACPGPADEAPEELPLPPVEGWAEGTIQGRVGADGAGPGWQVCAFRIDSGEPTCMDLDGTSFSLVLPAGRYHVLAFGAQQAVGAHTASTTCLRDGGVDCTDGTLLEVQVVADGTVPAIDILDFANARPEWPQAPAR